MSNKFTRANAASLQAVGRVSSGGRRLPLTLDIGSSGDLFCSNEDGFNIHVRIADIMNAAGRASRLRMSVPSSLVICTLADGSVILCEGHINPSDGTLRLDAVDQDEFYWFWIEVRRKHLAAWATGR